MTLRTDHNDPELPRDGPWLRDRLQWQAEALANAHARQRGRAMRDAHCKMLLEMKARHFEAGQRLPHVCGMCNQPWPCDAMKAIVAYEALQAENAAMFCAWLRE